MSADPFYAAFMRELADSGDARAAVARVVAAVRETDESRQADLIKLGELQRDEVARQRRFVAVLEAAAATRLATVRELRSRSRQADVVSARRVAAVALRAAGASFPAIGQLLGGRDHSTTMWQVESASDSERAWATEALRACGIEARVPAKRAEAEGRAA